MAKHTSDFFTGILGALVFFEIVLSPLGADINSILIGIVCLLVLVFYIFRPNSMGKRLSALQIAIVIAPTIALLSISLLSHFLMLELGGFILWVSYAILTAVSIEVAASLD